MRKVDKVDKVPSDMQKPIQTTTGFQDTYMSANNEPPAGPEAEVRESQKLFGINIRACCSNTACVLHVLVTGYPG